MLTSSQRWKVGRCHSLLWNLRRDYYYFFNDFWVWEVDVVVDRPILHRGIGLYYIVGEKKCRLRYFPRCVMKESSSWHRAWPTAGRKICMTHRETSDVTHDPPSNLGYHAWPFTSDKVSCISIVPLLSLLFFFLYLADSEHLLLKYL